MLQRTLISLVYSSPILAGFELGLEDNALGLVLGFGCDRT